MKKATLTITFEKEKLEALTYYMEKKDVKLQAELSDTIQKFYEKYVPQPSLSFTTIRRTIVCTIRAISHTVWNFSSSKLKLSSGHHR